MATGGPDEETWKKMSKGERIAYTIWVAAAIGAIVVLAVLRFL
jgi:flagellar biosynthesis/type III secretory pathway M-ring protein FliF/YscJ